MHDASTYSNANPREMAKYLAPYFNQDVAKIAQTEPALLGTTLDRERSPADRRCRATLRR